MTRALILKELREHGWILLAVLLLDALGYAVIASSAKDEGSAFVALQRFTLWFGCLTALVVNNRLVVREFTARTQLFLETLPITRSRVITVKLTLGAGPATTDTRLNAPSRRGLRDRAHCSSTLMNVT